MVVYLSDAATYYAHPNEDLLIMRQHIKKVGRTIVPIDFLQDTSRDTIVQEWGKEVCCDSLYTRRNSSGTISRYEVTHIILSICV